jgi:hypothetical protein
MISIGTKKAGTWWGQGSWSPTRGLPSLEQQNHIETLLRRDKNKDVSMLEFTRFSANTHHVSRCHIDVSHIV